MPTAHAEHASMSALSQDQPRKDIEGRAGRLSKEAVAICPTDDEAVVPRKKVDKQSFDYLWRSGTAGGLAGCAVGFASRPPHAGNPLLTDLRNRPKLSSHRLTESKFSSRREIRYSSSTPDLGPVQPPL